VIFTPAYLGRGIRKYAGRAAERYGFFRRWRRAEHRARTCSREAIRSRQWRKLLGILEHACREIPYYRDRFHEAGLTPGDIRGPEDLCRIPLLTKDDVRQNFPDRLVLQGRDFEEWHLGQTSGSTAESMHYIRPDDARHRGLYYSVFLRAGGITNLPVVMFTTPHCTAGTCSLREAREIWIHRIQRIPLLRHLDQIIGLPSSGNILSATDDYWAGLTETIRRLSPCILIVDPVYLGALARFLRKGTVPVPEIRYIVSTFELLTGSLRDLIRDVFGCDPYTQYGGSEVLDVANECERHTLHVMSENVWVEAIRDGRPAKPGEIGTAVLTDLTNANMPFIRYDIGDLIEWGDGQCPCGRRTDTIAAVHGRARDVIRASGPGGARLVTPLQADEAFRGIPGIAWYRLVQVAANRFRISIVPDGDPQRIDRDELLARCRLLLGEGQDVQMRFVEEIKPERSMKFRFVYSEVPQAEI
jgi:phenylacetate-CoA ligase